ncbi:MAG: hypothetical protein V1780_01795 [Chloroflexota bacterium]
MHFMLDTEDADSAAETFWPEGYKLVIREDVRELVGARLSERKRLNHLYRPRYAERYADLNQFLGKIADMVVIGAENGADDTFEDTVSAFLAESPLPEVPRYVRYFWPWAFPRWMKQRLEQVIIAEYRQDDVYQHAYSSYYHQVLSSFDEFMARVSRAVVTGAANGADDMLEAVYRSLVPPQPLPPARRYPRRLKLLVPV